MKKELLLALGGALLLSGCNPLDNVRKAADESADPTDYTYTGITPTKPQLYDATVSVAENSPAGTLIASVQVNNGHRTITAVTLSGAGAANFEATVTGQLKVAAGANLDYETATVYNLTGVATNSMGDSLPGTLTVNIIDVLEVTDFSGTIKDGATAGTVVGQLSTGYAGTLTSIALSGTAASDFSIANDGTITVAAGVTIDRNTRYLYDLTATVTANGVTDTASVTIITGVQPLKTGQTKSYNIGGAEVVDDSVKDDGYYETGRPRSYTRNALQDIVTDNTTGLVWQDAAVNTSALRSHADATAYCGALVHAGQSDWRLPTRQELYALADRGRYSPAIDPAFAHAAPSAYWSSTSYVAFPTVAWGVIFSNAYGGAYFKTYKYYVRCVRGGE